MAEPLNLDLRGLLGVRAQLALATLPPQLRRRLLNNALKRVRARPAATSPASRARTVRPLNRESARAAARCLRAWSSPST